MKSVLIAIILISILPSLSFAYGSPDYKPDGVHPRIYLTSTVLAEYNALQNASDSKWTDLETWCDAHFNDAGYDTGSPKWDDNNGYNGYRMSGYTEYLLSFGLAYQVLKDDNPTKAATYATYIRNILIDGIAGSFSAGDEANNGIIALRGGEVGADTTINDDEATALGLSSTYSYKLGYPTRNLRAVPIAYDWIYDTLSTADKDIIEAMLLRWFDWIRGTRSTYNNGILIGTTRYHEDTDGDCSGSNNCTTASTTAQLAYAFNDTGNNFFAGEAVFMIDTVMALYGDNTYADSLLSYVSDTIVDTRMLDVYGSDLRLSGGDSSEGNTYYGGYQFAIRGLYAYYTATGRDIFSSLSWDEDLLSNNINRVFPDFITVPVWGDSNATGARTNRAYVLVPFSGINIQVNPADTMTGVGKWMVDNYGYSRPSTQDQNFLWDYKNPTATVQSPLAAGIEPYHYAKGTGLVTMRSSWANSDDAVFGAIRIEAKREAAHENYDEGGFYVARGDDALIDRITYDDRIIMTSTIDFAELGASSPDADSLTETAIDRMVNTTDYNYTRGEVSGETSGVLYSKWHDNKADLFRRSFLFIRPNIFIVYDVTKSNQNRSNQKDWYTQFYGEPTVSGMTSSYVNGTSKAYVEVLHPSGGTLTKENNTSSYTPGNWWNTHYTVDTNQYDQFLHVIEATGSTDSQTATSLVTGSYVRGAKVGNTVAMFTSNQDGDDVQTATYTVDATTHYITDLPVNTDISVTRAGTEIVTDSNSGDAGIIEFTAASGSAEYVVTAGDYVEPPATCSDGVQNGDETGVDCGGSCVVCSGTLSSGVISILPPTLHLQ